MGDDRMFACPPPRRIIDDTLYAHFVTFSVFRRRRLLDHDTPKRIVLGVLNELLEEMDSRCIGFVLMPDHFMRSCGFRRLASSVTSCTNGSVGRA